jgi:hypothetical protein
MKKGSAYLLLCLSLIAFQVNAQDNFYKSVQQDTIPALAPVDKLTIGVGVGQDFGGVGAGLLFYPVKSVGLFAGAGYAIAGFGFNAGAKVRFISKKPSSKLTPYALAMYGYNAAIAVSGASEYNKLFYGPTFGAGLDFHFRPAKRGYWSLALLIPIRSSEVDDYMNDLEQNHGVQFTMGLFPVGFSFGYRFILL